MKLGAVRIPSLPAAALVAAALTCTLASTPASAKGSPEPAAVAISYADLVGPDEMLRSGALLRESLATASPELLQPHLARYSSLLSYAVQMLAGEDPAPQESVADAYPPGSAQPAWAAILREGRIRVTADRRGRARVFLPGDDPRAAWRAHYSVVRHPLGRLLPPGGEALLVEVYAYRNDYRALELRLNPEPYRFRSRAFPPKGTPLDLAGLERFFASGGALEGAEIDPDDGLVLYARAGEPQTLAGKAPTLADFATAYRAVFHAGDAPAFVSIDRHRDPLLGAVNFGGLLEDTRIGSVVLAADKRFKTVVSGLDPESGEDIRAKVRATVPDFLTNSERAFLLRDPASEAAWISTRYWFYPGSTGVDADPGLALAAVTRPRFTADAERTGVDYRPEEAARRRLLLPAEVRANIKHLNDHYGKYAARFPELRELTVVARMVAVCAWLQKARPDRLDLDGLLAVELPAVATARVVPYQLDAEYALLPRTGSLDAARVMRESRVVHVNPLLERSVEEVFRSPAGLAVLLRLKVGGPGAEDDEIAKGAERTFGEMRGRKVRELVATEGDLRALLRAVALVSSRHRRVDDGARLRRLMAERKGLDPADEEGKARAAQLDEEIAGIMQTYHQPGGGEDLRPMIHAGYTGGITMAPRLFAVKEKKDSPALQRLKQARAGAAAVAGGAGSAGAGAGAAAGAAGGWIRSRPVKVAKAATAGKPAASAPSTAPAAGGATTAAGAPTPPAAPAAARPAAPAKATAPAVPGRPAPAPAPQTPAPPKPDRDQTPVVEEVVAAPERPAAAPQRAVIAARDSAVGAVTGRIQAGGKIVFTRAPQ